MSQTRRCTYEGPDFAMVTRVLWLLPANKWQLMMDDFFKKIHFLKSANLGIKNLIEFKTLTSDHNKCFKIS